MASRRDFAALRIISATKRKAERDGEDVLFELSGGDDYFENAIRAIKNSGETTIICMMIIVVVLVVLFLFAVLNPNINSSFDSLVKLLSNIATPLIIFGLPNIFFSYKVKTLSITPVAILTFTIFSLILNLLCFFSFVTIIASIFNIIALTKYSAYKEWFYSIDVNYYREKANANKIKRQ